uniref:NADH-ubiquinone oxidoreductase chain 2 n=1 Tax=Myrmecocephalus concinnus TaxID=1143072 RepID=A0A0S2M7Y7_9COLE|nr:NADH dehydrogenase subunit 2 [Myrmecocephalus concinnus]ALO70716.1 NADH deshydrogenase subunit 2 [Myrmecocephalus concinnus]
MFLWFLMFGSFISISANSWMGMWLGLEINLLAFIPLIQENNNSFSSESALKYFLTQTIASMIFLFTVIFMSKQFIYLKYVENYIMIMFNSALLMKMGMAPFHFWFPEVIDGLNWFNSLMLLTWQKITPMILVMYNMYFSYFFLMIIVFSMLISGFMGLNQHSLRKFLAYSSINHMAWMISAMLYSESIWFYYFIIYSILSLNLILFFKLFNIFYYNQLIISINNNFLLKFFFSLNFLSLGGLPPFIGFFPKWLIIQFMINSNWFMLAFFMVMLTLFTLFYYMQLIFNILILNNNEINYFKNFSHKNELYTYFTFLSLSSLMFFSLSLNFT